MLNFSFLYCRQLHVHVVYETQNKTLSNSRRRGNARNRRFIHVPADREAEQLLIGLSSCRFIDENRTLITFANQLPCKTKNRRCSPMPILWFSSCARSIDRELASRRRNHVRRSSCSGPPCVLCLPCPICRDRPIHQVSCCRRRGSG